MTWKPAAADSSRLPISKGMDNMPRKDPRNIKDVARPAAGKCCGAYASARGTKPAPPIPQMKTAIKFSGSEEGNNRTVMPVLRTRPRETQQQECYDQSGAVNCSLMRWRLRLWRPILSSARCAAHTIESHSSKLPRCRQGRAGPSTCLGVTWTVGCPGHFLQSASTWNLAGAFKAESKSTISVRWLPPGQQRARAHLHSQIYKGSN